MSKLIALRLLGEAVALAVTRAFLNHLTLFHDRGEDQVIDFLRPIDHEQLEQLFTPEQERVAGFWKVRAEQNPPDSLTQSWAEVELLLEELPSLTDQEFEEFGQLADDEITSQVGFTEEKTLPFWKMGIAFRLEQRGRLDLAREYLQRMYHNARILEQWAASQWFYQKRYGEADEINASQLAVMKALRDKAKRFRMFALAALIRIWLRCLVPFHETRLLPIPSIAALRRVGHFDLLAAYEQVKECALALGRLSADEFAHELALKV